MVIDTKPIRQEEELEKMRELAEQNQKLKEEVEQYRQVQTRFMMHEQVIHRLAGWSVLDVNSFELTLTEITSDSSDQREESSADNKRISRHIVWIRSSQGKIWNEYCFVRDVQQHGLFRCSAWSAHQL